MVATKEREKERIFKNLSALYLHEGVGKVFAAPVTELGGECVQRILFLFVFISTLEKPQPLPSHRPNSIQVWCLSQRKGPGKGLCVWQEGEKSVLILLDQ